MLTRPADIGHKRPFKQHYFDDMRKDTIYLYVDGSDLDESEAELTAAFAGLATEWRNSPLSLVNEWRAQDGATHSEDLPEWFLGLNAKADAVTEVDLDLLLRFAKDLAAQTGRDFVFGLADQHMHSSEDLCFIGANAGDRERLMMLTALAKH